MVRGKPSSVANHVMKDQRYRPFVLAAVGKAISNEVINLCSDGVSSILRKANKEDLSSFTWDKVLEEAKQFSPCLFEILKNSLKAQGCKSVKGMIISLFCLSQNSTMNVVQKLVALVLYGGHCSKQVIIITTLLIVIILFDRFMIV